MAMKRMEAGVQKQGYLVLGVSAPTHGLGQSMVSLPADCRATE